jgi:hypothetical protein
VDGPLHATYLPYSQTELKPHFATVAGGGDPVQHLEYYLISAWRTEDHAAFHEKPPAVGRKVPMCKALAHQIEKDERFWIVTALLKAFHSEDRVGSLERLLSDAFGATPPFPGDLDWVAALGEPEDLCLFFEANLPAPRAYKEDFAGEAHGGKSERLLLPYLRGLAAVGNKHLEGATKVDAILVAPSTGFSVVFEAKVLSDASTHTTYDGVRNQIARNIDVLMESNTKLMPQLNARCPDRTLFLLLTPQLFLDRPQSRLYGTLMNAYRHDAWALKGDLPHRSLEQLKTMRARLGWTSWERVNELLPGSCPWLDVAAPSAAAE